MSNIELYEVHAALANELMRKQHKAVQEARDKVDRLFGEFFSESIFQHDSIIKPVQDFLWKEEQVLFYQTHDLAKFLNNFDEEEE